MKYVCVLFIKEPYGLGKEAVSQSTCLCFGSPVSPL